MLLRYGGCPQEAPLLQEFYRVGELVPGTNYRIMNPMGEGFFGVVFAVEDEKVGLRRALKMLRPNLVNRYAARMQLEWKVLGRLWNNPHIVQVITADHTADERRTPFLVMEYLRGDTLRETLRVSSRFGLDRALDTIVDLLDALAAAHDLGVIHRDVKPENVFIVRPEPHRLVAKLLDFGIVRLRDGQAYTSQGMLGTARYTAPELFVGDPATPESDIYAAGMVLYEMLAGRHPFADAPSLPKAHRMIPPMPMRQLLPDLPDALFVLLDWMIEKDPARRASSARLLYDRFNTLRSQMRVSYAMGADVTEEDGIESILRRAGAVSPDEVTFAPEPEAEPEAIMLSEEDAPPTIRMLHPPCFDSASMRAAPSQNDNGR